MAPLGLAELQPSSLFAEEDHLEAQHDLRRQGFAVVRPGARAARDLDDALAAWRRFFAEVPRGDKERLALDKAGCGGGWLDLGGKEVFEVPLEYDATLRLPCDAVVPTLAAMSVVDAACRTALGALGRELSMQPCGLLGLLDELPLKLGRTGSSLLHASCYSAAAADAGGSGAAVAGTEAHTDRGLLTLIVQSAEDLEVRRPGGGEWQRVALQPGEAMLLPGWSLEAATAGAITAAEHRVRPAAPRRISLAYKLRVRSDALLDAAALMRRDRAALAKRHQEPLTGGQLMAAFNEAHPRSVNRPAAAGVAAAASCTGGSGAAAPTEAAALVSANKVPAAEAPRTPLPCDTQQAPAAQASSRAPYALRSAARKRQQEEVHSQQSVPGAQPPAARRARRDQGPVLAQQLAGPPALRQQPLAAQQAAAQQEAAQEEVVAQGEQQPQVQQEAAAAGQQEGPQLEEAQAPAGQGDEVITLILKDADGAEVHIRVKRTTPFERVFVAYAQQRGVDLHSLRFITDGQVVKNWQDTLALWQMEDGDVIDVFTEVMGD